MPHATAKLIRNFFCMHAFRENSIHCSAPLSDHSSEILLHSRESLRFFFYHSARKVIKWRYTLIWHFCSMRRNSMIHQQKNIKKNRTVEWSVLAIHTAFSSVTASTQTHTNMQYVVGHLLGVGCEVFANITVNLSFFFCSLCNEKKHRFVNLQWQQQMRVAWPRAHTAAMCRLQWQSINICVYYGNERSEWAICVRCTLNIS